jgi:predicted dehydrogenase/nucleoside-diphosphate-sugar epimerase
MRKVLLVGAGFIAGVHAEALREVGTAVAWAITDLNPEASRRLANRWSIPNVFATLDEAIASGQIDCAHVLTPPDYHFDVVMSLLRARIPVLVEKPLAATSSQCEALVREAESNGVTLGVNHNLLFFPAYQRLESEIGRGALGEVLSIDYSYSVQLRQLAARQFGHWMFRDPTNLLLEQAIHPLSQIVGMVGNIEHVAAEAAAPLEISKGRALYPSFLATLRRGSVPTRLNFAVGRSFPFWQVRVECSDGVGIADMTNNRAFFYKRTRWLEPVDQFLSGGQTASQILANSGRNLSKFALSTSRLLPRSDAFFAGMRNSIRSFHDALQKGKTPRSSARFGSDLVLLCERIAESASFATNTVKRVQTGGTFDVAVIGGTGFIGSHVIEQLLARGHRVSVLARNLQNLPDLYESDRVVLVPGDARNRADVERAIGSAKFVVNLAHGGGGETFEALRNAMMGSTENVARVCVERGINRLVHIGSMASLYLGNANDVVTGSSAVDPRWEHRADYARAKAEADLFLLAQASGGNLPVHILRPGVVVGRGGIPLHGALGFFNNDQHCLGWSRGQTPMPFVLVDDVADAIVRALLTTRTLQRTYNVVGDVHLTAREYFKELARALRRPLKFHPQSPMSLWLKETGKWAVKRLTGRKNARPTLHDFRSRTLVARFDCSDVKSDLEWVPEADVQAFIRRGIEVYAEATI